jgi:hypothetical protein
MYEVITVLAIKLIFFSNIRKFAKATISFVMPGRPSVRTEQHCSLWMDFHEV